MVKEETEKRRQEDGKGAIVQNKECQPEKGWVRIKFCELGQNVYRLPGFVQKMKQGIAAQHYPPQFGSSSGC